MSSPNTQNPVIAAADRPDHGPRQVRCLCQIKEGRTYICAHGDGSVDSIVIHEITYSGEHGWRIHFFEDTGSSSRIYAADFSVVPYSIGHWNTLNWLEVPDGEKLPECPPAFIAKRPDFGPNQVRCMCQVKMGDTFTLMQEGISLGTILVLAPPWHKNVRERWVIAVQQEEDGTGNPAQRTLSLEDLHVVPGPLCEPGKRLWLAFTPINQDRAGAPPCNAFHLHCRRRTGHATP